MFPSSAIHVIQQTPSQLVVVDSPYYALGTFFTLAGVIWFLWVLIANLRSNFEAKLVGLGFLFALPFLLVGLALLTGRTRTTFSRDSATMTVERRYFWITISHRQFPLDSVRNAVVEGGRGRTLVVLLSSGTPVVIASRTDRQGYYEAATAINNFMHGQGLQR